MMNNLSAEQPFISIIIPTRRESEILNRCLDSLLSQDYPSDKFEIILIPEEKLNIKEGKKIKIIYNTTYSQSRNRAAAIARGEIFAFVDDDCLVPTDWLSKGAKYFKEEKVALIGGPALPHQDDPNRCYRIGGYLLGSPLVTGFASCRYRLISRIFGAKEHHLLTANNFLRRKAFNAVSGFDMEISASEETDLYFRLRRKGYKMLYVPEIFVWHRARPVFLPLISKIFCYATGRGILMAKKPNTIRLMYFIPSLFIAGLFSFIFLSLFFREFFYILSGILFIYLLSITINAFYIFFKSERHPLVFLYSLLATTLVHFSYGLGILFGFYKYISSGRRGL